MEREDVRLIHKCDMNIADHLDLVNLWENVMLGIDHGQFFHFDGNFDGFINQGVRF